MVASTTPRRLTAYEDMDEQLRMADGYGYSLSRMWRSAGCPEQKDPARWLLLAGDFIREAELYLRRLSKVIDDPTLIDFGNGGQAIYSMTESPQVIENDPLKDEVPPWQAGDISAHPFIAKAYAWFLDAPAHSGNWIMQSVMDIKL